MKKLITIDDFAVACIAALGYGFGFTVAQRFGLPFVLCFVVCLVVGMALEALTSMLAFSEVVQRKPLYRVLLYAGIILIVVMGEFVSVASMGESMSDYLVGQFAYVILFPVVVFVLNLCIRIYRIKQIRKQYGDGSEGYVFDVTKKDIEEVNRENRPIHGSYPTDCAVKTRTGIYVGEKYKKALAFLGIPYAQPPVGELRWKAPQPLPSSQAVFEAKNFGATAIQVEHRGSLVKQHRQSEDCLTLNIAVGSQKTEEKKPVLVLFHPGDFTYGGSVDPLLYGGEFVNRHQDIVFVSFDYRLGIFGFIDFSRVPGGEDYPDAPNLGLLDQIAALQWVQENIGAFGGDPQRVTVLGFESGAASICLLAASPRAKGLFQRAFVCGGSPANVYDTPEAARALADDLLKETGAGTMEELLRLDTETLKRAAQRLWRSMCAPTCNGTWLPVNVYRAYQEGVASGIPFVIGLSRGEMQVFRSFMGEQNYRDLMDAAVADMRSCLDPGAAQAVQKYLAAQTGASGELAAKSKLMEQWYALGIYRSGAKLAQGGNQVHLLYWDEKPLIENLGSGTVDVAAALLGNYDALQMYGSVVNQDLAEALQVLLEKFISGKPLRLYPNEIKGVDALDWETFPQALAASEGKLLCRRIEDKITDVDGLLDFAVKS